MTDFLICITMDCWKLASEVKAFFKILKKKKKA